MTNDRLNKIFEQLCTEELRSLLKKIPAHASIVLLSFNFLRNKFPLTFSYFIFELEELSDKPADCEVTYEKVGCYKDEMKDRALSEEMFSMRNEINWKAGEWEKFLKRQVFFSQVTHYNLQV